MATCYETLGIDPHATPDEVAQAYRFLAQKFHPDVNPDSVDLARKRFQVVQEAYDILSDPQRRREYDVKLASGIGADWERIGMNTDNGGVRFNSDGSLNIAGRRIGAEDGVQRSTIGAATIEKDAGTGGEFRIWHNGKEHRFRFANGAWHAKRERPKGTSSPPAEKPARSMAPSSPPVVRVPNSVPQVLPNPSIFSKRNLSTAAIILAVGLVAGYFVSRTGSRYLALTPEEQLAQKEQELNHREQLASLNAKIQDHAEVETIQRQHNAVARDKFLTAKRNGEGALASVDALITEIKRWEEEIPNLLISEDGKKLAASEQNVRVFQSLRDKPKPTSAEAGAMRIEIEALLTPVNAAIAAGSFAEGGAELLGELLRAKKDEVDGQLTVVRQAREGIRNLVALSVNKSPASVTLEQAIISLSLGDTQREADLIAKTEKEARESATDKLVKARRALVEAEEARKRAAVENETVNVNAQADHAKNLAEAKTTTVQNALRFFLTRGYYQPGDASDYEKTTEPHPISYSKLAAYGALEPSNTGLARLLFVVTNFPDDRRTRWKMDRYIGSLSPDETQRLHEAQDYLRRLGDALVELKVLDP